MEPVGHFRDEAARNRFLEAYRVGMEFLPAVSQSFDIATTFGSTRVHRFDGPTDGGTPVVMLPGRNASTPMWRANLPGVLSVRTAYCVDLIGEPGLSVQTRALTGDDDQAQWLDETLAGLGLDRAHLLGVSIGGRAAVACAVWRPGRVASLVLLDPAMTFAPIPAKTAVAAIALQLPRVPAGLRRRVLRWIAGGAEVDDAEPEAALISAGTTDFVVQTPMPRVFTDDQLRSLPMPVLALIAGRSVMLDPARASARARKLLRHGQIEVWTDASHALNGEYPAEIATRTRAFWDEVDGSRRDFTR